MINFLIFIFPADNVNAQKTIYVDALGGRDFTSIQAAINSNSTNDGDTVFVYSGIYDESLNVYKSIRLIGEDRYSTVINADSEAITINSDGVTIEGFTINSNEYGIYINTRSGNLINSNEILSCSIGIFISGATENNVIFQNNISWNIEYGIWIDPDNYRNLIYHNNFENNNIQAYDLGSNFWDDGYPSGGNYWSDYTGVDDNGDGIGDTAYFLFNYSNTDRYPLMKSYKWFNSPPNIPTNPNPANNSVNISIETDLNWIGGDPDDDPVSYDVYFGINSTPSIVATGFTITTYALNTLSLDKQYYWRIKAWDDKGASTTGPVWTFTTTKNKPPYKPSNPKPADNSNITNINTNLSWTGGDPDGDAVTYDVFFGTNSNPPNVATGQTSTTYNPGTLKINTKYYWRIDAWDEHRLKNKGETWEFKIEEQEDGIDLVWAIIPVIVIGIGIPFLLRLRKPKKPEEDQENEKEDDENEDEIIGYLISAVRYSKKHRKNTHIIKLRVHQEKKNLISTKYFIEDRKTVINNIHNNKTYHTITRNKVGQWVKGSKVKVVKIKDEEFLKTVDNKTKQDNLENLPEF